MYSPIDQYHHLQAEWFFSGTHIRLKNQHDKTFGKIIYRLIRGKGKCNDKAGWIVLSSNSSLMLLNDIFTCG